MMDRLFRTPAERIVSEQNASVLPALVVLDFDQPVLGVVMEALGDMGTDAFLAESSEAVVEEAFVLIDMDARLCLT